LGDWVKTSRKSFSPRRGSSRSAATAKQLVGQIHEHALVSGGVIGERDAQFAGQERRIAGGSGQVVEASH
jgi:hypothetical protein